MITTRNRCADLQATCRRLVALQPQPQEVLICADGCTDGSGAMVRTEFPKFHLIENDTALGSVAARHRLLTIATGDIVVSLDDDSYPADNDFFARLPDTFAAHPEAAVITFPELRNERTSAPDTGRILSVPTSSDFLPLSPRGTSGERDGERGSSTIGRPPSGHYVSAYPNCAAAMRRDVYLKTGGYPPFFFHGYEEPDYALQCYAAGYAVWFEPSLPIRHHQATANRSPFRFHQSNARNEIWSVWLRCPWPWLPLVSLFRGWRQFRYACTEGWSWALQEPLWWVAALAGVRSCWRARRPLPWQIYFAWMRLARNPIYTMSDLRAKFPTVSNSAVPVRLDPPGTKGVAIVHPLLGERAGVRGTAITHKPKAPSLQRREDLTQEIE